MFLYYFLLAHEKSVFHQPLHYNLSFPQLKENVGCNLFAVQYLHMIKQKASLLPENLDQLSNLNIGFVPTLIF